MSSLVKNVIEKASQSIAIHGNGEMAKKWLHYHRPPESHMMGMNDNFPSRGYCPKPIFAVVNAKMKTTDLFYKRAGPKVIELFLTALAGIRIAWFRWQKWCDPIIAFGREIHFPGRLVLANL